MQTQTHLSPGFSHRPEYGQPAEPVSRDTQSTILVWSSFAIRELLTMNTCLMDHFASISCFHNNNKNTILQSPYQLIISLHFSPCHLVSLLLSNRIYLFSSVYLLAGFREKEARSSVRGEVISWDMHACMSHEPLPLRRLPTLEFHLSQPFIHKTAPLQTAKSDLCVRRAAPPPRWPSCLVGSSHWKLHKVPSKVAPPPPPPHNWATAGPLLPSPHAQYAPPLNLFHLTHGGIHLHLNNRSWNCTCMYSYMSIVCFVRPCHVYFYQWHFPARSSVLYPFECCILSISWLPQRRTI